MRKLYGDSEYPGKNYCSSLRLAEEVEIMVGRPGLEKILKQAVPDEDFVPSRLYKKLMELPWCDIFTTNYDTLIGTYRRSDHKPSVQCRGMSGRFSK